MSSHSRPLTPECRLVFGAAHVEPNEAEIAELSRLPLNWTRVIGVAELEKATPLLWRAIQRAGTSSLPREAAEHLRRSALVNDFRMLRLASRIEKTLVALREQGTPVLLLKGAALATTAYAGFTDRPMTDVDLLVRMADVPRAREAVIESGWPETTDPVLRSLLENHHHLPHFVDPEPTGLRVELHTSILPADQPFRLDEEVLWATATPARAPFHGGLVAEPKFLLLHACQHFAWSHVMQFGGWRTFRDVSALTRDPAFDWDAFVALARDSKSATACYWTFRLAARMSDVRIPAEVMRQLAPPTGERIRRSIERHFIAGLAPGEAPPCPSITVARVLWLAALRPKWSGHAAAGTFDPEHKWEKTLGTASTETFAARVFRHATGIRHWWNFAADTVSPFS